MTPLAQPAFAISMEPWQGSTYRVQLLTPDLGLVSVLMDSSKYPCSEFQLLDVDLSKVQDHYRLYSLRAQNLFALKGAQLFSGLYLNELLNVLLPRQDTNQSLFGLYQSTLQYLANGKIPHAALRYFERRLLEELGYGINFDYDVNQTRIDPEKWYQFFPGTGFYLAEAGDNRVLGNEILAIRNNDYDHSGKTSGIARVLFAAQIDLLLDGQTLKSRQLIRDALR